MSFCIQIEFTHFLGGHCPRHLVNILCEAYCLSSKNLEATDQMQIGLTEINHLLGHLFSAVLSNLTHRGYRIRTYINNTYTEPATERIFIRLFGCLSYETSPMEADYNRIDRRNKYAFLHSEINPLVSSGDDNSCITSILGGILCCTFATRCNSHKPTSVLSTTPWPITRLKE